MSVADYEARFHELGQFAQELLSTEEDKMFLFLPGMNPDLQVTIRGLCCVSLTDMVRRSIGVERGLFIQRDLDPKKFKEAPSSSSGKKGEWKKGSQQTQSGVQASTYRSGGGQTFIQQQCSTGQRGSKEQFLALSQFHGHGRPTSTQPLRVYALTQEEDDASPAVVQ
ncbi:hypothetical protein Dimus_035446, partial [Dionaea muscipula]